MMSTCLFAVGNMGVSCGNHNIHSCPKWQKTKISGWNEKYELSGKKGIFNHSTIVFFYEKYCQWNIDHYIRIGKIVLIPFFQSSIDVLLELSSLLSSR